MTTKKVRDIKASGTRVRAPVKDLAELATVSRDVAERERAEEALNNNNNKLLQTIRSGRSPIVIIAVTTIAIIVISIYCLASGYFIIFQNLFYIPIIIACMYYTKRGFAFSVIIACLYFLLMIAFTRESSILLQAFIRVLIFVLVAGVITYLSLARKRVEESLRRQQDNLEGLVQERTALLEEGITERKQSEEALRISKDRLLFATEGANLGVWNWNTVTGELIWSDKCKALFGIPLDETMSYPRFSDALHPDDRERTDRAVKDALDNHKDYDIEYRSLWPDGSIHWLAAKGRGYYDATGNALRLEGVVQNISERKREEEELRKYREHLEVLVEQRTRELREMEEKTEREYTTIVQTALDGYWVNDLKGRILDVNDSYCQMIGYSREELLTMNIADIKAYERPDGVARHIDKIMKQGYDRFETRHRRKDGTPIDVDVSVNYIDIGGGRLIEFVRDITERKKAQEELEENRRRLDIAVEASQIGIWELDLISDTSIRNLRHAQIFGYEEVLAEWGAKTFFEHIIPEDRPSVKAAFDEAMKTGKVLFECRIIWPDKSIHWITATGKAFGDSTEPVAQRLHPSGLMMTPPGS